MPRRRMLDRGPRRPILALLAGAALAGCCDSGSTTPTPPTEPPTPPTGTTTTPTASGGSAGLPWPIAIPATGLEILRTDCQVQNGCSYKIHNGIDLPAAVGTEVRAVAPGVVVWTKLAGTNADGVVVATPGDEYAGFYYGHLTDILVYEGLPVAVDDVLGHVRQWTVAPSCNEQVDHLHLQAARTGSLSVDSEGVVLWPPPQYASDGNTMKRMDPSVDVAKPEIVDVEENLPFYVCPAGSMDAFAPALVSEPLKLPAGPVDVIARVHDRLREGSNPLAPYSVQVGLRLPGSEGWVRGPQGFVFDGEIPGLDFDWKLIYRYDDVRKTSVDLTDPVFLYDLGHDDGDGVLEVEDAGSALDLTSVLPGVYELCIIATDAAGHTEVKPMEVEIESP